MQQGETIFKRYYTVFSLTQIIYTLLQIDTSRYATKENQRNSSGDCNENKYKNPHKNNTQVNKLPGNREISQLKYTYILQNLNEKEVYYSIRS